MKECGERVGYIVRGDIEKASLQGANTPYSARQLFPGTPLHQPECVRVCCVCVCVCVCVREREGVCYTVRVRRGRHKVVNDETNAHE